MNDIRTSEWVRPVMRHTLLKKRVDAYLSFMAIGLPDAAREEKIALFRSISRMFIGAPHEASLGHLAKIEPDGLIVMDVTWWGMPTTESAMSPPHVISMLCTLYLHTTAASPYARPAFSIQHISGLSVAEERQQAVAIVTHLDRQLNMFIAPELLTYKRFNDEDL